MSQKQKKPAAKAVKATTKVAPREKPKKVTKPAAKPKKPVAKDYSEFQIGVLTPGTLVYPVSANDYITICEAVMDDLALTTDIFQGNASSGPTPSRLMLYFLVLLYSHVRRVGSLAGASHMLVPNADPEWAVPTPIAKWLQGLGRYAEDGASASSTISLTGDITFARQGYGVDNFFTSLDIARSPSQMNKNWFPFASLNNELDNRAFNLADTIQLSTAPAELYRQISMAVVNAGLEYVTFKEIPDRAPNASAYARGFDQETETFVAIAGSTTRNIVMKCPFRNFNSEEAVLYASYQNLGAVAGFLPVDARSKMMPTYPEGPISVATGVVSNVNTVTSYNIPHFVFTHLWHRQRGMPRGAILKTTSWCEAPVRTLLPGERIINMNAFNSAVIAAYCQLLDCWNNAGVDAAPFDPTGQALTVMWCIASMSLQRRINESSYVRNQMLFNLQGTNGHGSSQPYFVDKDIKEVGLPAVLAEFIASIGPVCYDGQMVYPIAPVLDKASLGFSSYTGLQTGYWQLAAWRALTPTPTFDEGGSGHLPVVPFGTPVLATVLDGAVLASEVPTYYASVDATFLPGPQGQLVYPLQRTGDLLSIYQQLHQTRSIGGNLLQTLVHPHSDPCGYADIMLTFTSGGTYPTGGQQFPDFAQAQTAFGTDPWNFTYPTKPSMVSGSIRLLPAHAARAITLGVFTVIKVGGGQGTYNGKFSYNANAGYRSNNSLRAFTSATYGLGTAFGSAIGERLGSFQPKYLEYGGVKLPSGRGDESCWFRETIADIWASLSPGLVPAATAAAAAACAPYGASGVCAAATQYIAETLNSYTGIKAAGVETYNKPSPVSVTPQPTSTVRPAEIRTQNARGLRRQ